MSMNAGEVPHKAVAGPWERYGWLMAAVWLVFLIFPGLELAQSPAPEWLILVGWIGLGTFAIVYVTGFVVGMRGGWQRPTRTVITLFFIAIGCAALTIPAIGWNVTSFLPFLMAYAAYGIGKVWHWCATLASLLLISAHTVIALIEGAEPPWVLIGIIIMMAVVNSINSWLIERSIAADELRVELATSEERESVARDVHDLIGHSLTVVKLKAELAVRLVDHDPQAAKLELEEIARLTGETIAGVRGTVTGLKHGGFAEQLAASRTALESAGIVVTVSGSADALSPAQSLPAAWIVREATTNILRHARAQSAHISIEPGTVVVEDDGIGVQHTPGNGIHGMAERAAAAGAVFRVDPRLSANPENTGTRVSVVW